MSGETKFTPGPWRIGNSSPLLFGSVRGNGMEPLGFVYGPNAVESSEVYRRAIADAHLIAAAPELYEACKKLLYWADTIAPTPELANDRKMAIAVLAKA